MNFDDDDIMDRYQKALRVAVKNDALLMIMIMDTLIKMAELMATKGDKERAVEILTIALHYPMRQETRSRAEALYDDLEAELCPRVFADARTLAQEVTLDDLMAALLGKV
jgi:hypothetical protein